MAASGSARIGTRIRRARERRRWTQQDLAGRLGVNRKTVGNWENGRTYPKNRIGALEDELGVSLTEPERETRPVPVLKDDDERGLWEMTRLTERQRWKLITSLRRDRDGGPEDGGEDEEDAGG